MNTTALSILLAVAWSPLLLVVVVTFMVVAALGKTTAVVLAVTALALLAIAIYFIGLAIFLWLCFRLGLYGVVLCMEPLDKNWLNPMRRSWRLMHGHGWKWFVAALLAFAGLIPGLVLQQLASGPGRAAFDIAHPSIFLAAAIATAPATPFITTTQVAMYRAIRSEEQAT